MTKQSKRLASKLVLKMLTVNFLRASILVVEFRGATAAVAGI
jgi:hypothetical protein